MRVRLREVAERAGVSEATVSRVVNGRPGVKEGTRRDVQRALIDLGYASPGIPRPSRTRFVGLLVPELDNPIFPAFAQHIETLLAKHDIVSVLCTATSTGLPESRYIDLLLERGVAGFIVVSGMNADTAVDHELYRRLVHDGMPVVFVNGRVDDVDAPYVSADDGHAVELAVTHLATLGHERIGCVVGPRRYLPVQRKLAGFSKALHALGMTGNERSVVEADFGVEGGQAAADELLAQGVTGLVCASDLMALGAIRAVRARGLRVPADVSVVGYDDTPLMGFTDPPLTTLRQPVVAMSAAATRALLDVIDQRDVPARELLFRPELVVRGSTGPAPKATPIRAGSTRASRTSVASVASTLSGSVEPVGFATGSSTGTASGAPAASVAPGTGDRLDVVVMASPLPGPSGQRDKPRTSR